MFAAGKAYLRQGLEPDDGPPGWLGATGILLASVVLYFGATLAGGMLVGLFPSTLPGYGDANVVYRGIVRYSSVAIALLPVLLFQRRTLNVDFADVIFGTSRPRVMRFCAWAALTWIVMTITCLNTGVAIQWSTPNPVQIALWVPLAIATLLQSTAEEMIFRGYLSKLVFLVGRSIFPVLVIVPFVFFLGHRPHDLNGLAVFGGIGLYFSYLSLRTGDLQLAAAGHFANNFFANVAAVWLVQTRAVNGLLRTAIELAVLVLVLEAALYVEGRNRARTQDAV